MICANCKQEIKEGEGITLSVSSGTPMHTNCISKCMKCGNPITDEESLRNKFQCETCNPCSISKVELPKVVRRSYLELYKTCPYAFYHIAIKELELPNGVYALHGIILHELFDLYSTSEKKDEINLYDLFKERFHGEIPQDHLDFKLKPELFKVLYDKGIVAINNYLRYEESAPAPYATEERITFSVGEGLPDVSIAFDRVNKYGEELEIVDYKCGQVYSGQKLVTDLQLPLYVLAIKERFGKLPKTFRFLFLSEDKERVYELQADGTYVCQVRKRKYVVNLTEAIRDVKQILGDISKGKYDVPREVSSWYCERMCQLKKYGKCEGKDSQRWKGF